MGTEMVIVKKQSGEAMRRREKIELLEVPPQEEWFVEATTPRGRKVWYLRLAITGHRARLFGPFPSKRAALLFLDSALNKLGDFWAEVDAVRDRYACEGEFQHIRWAPLIEHPLAAPRLNAHEITKGW